MLWAGNATRGGGNQSAIPGRRRCRREGFEGHANVGAPSGEGSDANGPAAADGNDHPTHPPLRIRVGVGVGELLYTTLFRSQLCFTALWQRGRGGD